MAELIGDLAGAIVAQYDKHIEMYEQKEDAAISSLLQQSSSEVISLFNNLVATGDEQLMQAISLIENSINDLALGLTGSQAASQAANKMLQANNKLHNILDAETLSLLQELSSGSMSLDDLPPITDLEGQQTISSSEIGMWINKILYGLKEIQQVDKNTPTKLRGYVSNLKGAMLEEGVIKVLRDFIPVDAVVRTGNINLAGRGQIAEDIVLLYPSGRNEPLLSMLQKSQEKRATFSVPDYDLLQASGAGVSVKAGNRTIKYFEGNITHFFDNSVHPMATAYKNYLINRQNIKAANKMTTEDSAKQKLASFKGGASLNRLLVGAKLDQAIGTNNLFIVIRGKFFRTSAFLKRKKASNKAQLRMTGFGGTVDSVTGRIVGS